MADDDDPTEKRLLARLNAQLEWRSEHFRLGPKKYDLVEMGALLANVRRRTGYRFKPALVRADRRDSDITDHGASSEEEDDEGVEEKIGDNFFAKANSDRDESSDDEEEEEEKRVGDAFLDRMTGGDDDDDVDDGKTVEEMDDVEVAEHLQRLKAMNGY
jgi:hypothetical protein